METPINANKLGIHFRNALPQILAIMIKNSLLISFGMNIGYPTILIGGVLNENHEEFGNVSENEVSWLGSIVLLSVVIGSSASGIVTQPIGRKRSMQLITIPFIICWIIVYYAKQIWHLYLALALLGCFGGLVEAPFIAYVSEITQPYLRGILGTSGIVAFLIGILIQFILGSLYHWRKCAIISTGFPALTFFLFFFIPESPYWLLLNNKLEDTRKGLAWLRGWTTIEEIEPEFQNMLNRYKADNNNFSMTADSKCEQKVKICKQFSKKSFLWPFGLATLMFVLVHFTGASTLQTYSITIFATLDVPISEYNATIFSALAQLLGSILCVFLINIIGKRRVLFISLLAVCVADTAIATYAYITNAKYIILGNESTPMEKIGSHQWIPLLVLLFLSFIDHSGNFVLPWIIIGEIFSHETRSIGCGLSIAVSYIFNFISNNLFLRLVSGITLYGTYYFYASISLVGVISLYFILPETEGKTLEEISDHFAGKSKLDNKIGRKKHGQSVTGNNNLSFQP